MTKEELQNILEKHQLWLHGEEGGERANFEEADLLGANFAGFNFTGANFEGAYLLGANFAGSCLVEANFKGAYLAGANFEEANLEGVNFKKTYLKDANFKRARLAGTNLKKAYLVGANFEGANLAGANFEGANLKGANLKEANLSKAKGLLNTINYLVQNFEKTADGYIVYKVFGMYYPISTEWVIKEGSIIEEIVNSNRADTCGCGINVATREWIKNERAKITSAWKCLIKWEWLAGVVVPYNTDGKIRCERLMLLEEVDI